MKTISILLPTRNEEKYIEKCLNSILGFVLPVEILTEILVIDGMSTDRTREIVTDFCTKESNIRLLDNPKLYQVAALNTGIEKSKGEMILRLDAHAIYPENYLIDLYTTITSVDCDCAGGVVETYPGSDTFQAAIVQSVTTHPFGVGNSSFRTSESHGYRDTVPYGLFHREIFTKYGKYNEQLVSGEDYELSSRIRLNGAKIWQNGSVKIKYFNQPTLYKFYRKQFEREGHYNVYMWYLAPYTFALRHVLPGVFAAGVIGGLILSLFSAVFLYIFLAVMILYALLALISSFQQSMRYRKYLLFPVLPFCFFGFHFLYGLGIISGILKLAVGKAPVRREKTSMKDDGR